MSIEIENVNKILIVQPDDQTREMLIDIFKKNGFEVLEARDGAEGFSKADGEKKLNVIFIDLNMPRIDGLEFLKIKQENSSLANIPVVVYANFASEDDKKMILEAGATSVINKGTLSPLEIVQKISRAIRQGDYLLQVDPYALDAQQFMSDYHIGDNFKCNNCGTSLAIKLKTQRGKDTIAKIVCPTCGKEYL